MADKAKNPSGKICGIFNLEGEFEAGFITDIRFADTRRRIVAVQDSSLQSCKSC